MESKADYVRNAPFTRPHVCHWTGCEAQVKPAMWGCYKHWRMLPRALRAKIWGAYKPGQEETLQVSAKYIQAAREIQEWIANRAEKLKKLDQGNYFEKIVDKE